MLTRGKPVENFTQPEIDQMERLYRAWLAALGRTRKWNAVEVRAARRAFNDHIQEVTVRAARRDVALGDGVTS